MDATRVAGGIGRALVGVGLLILLFVAYQLWGTDISESRAQNRLRQEIRHELPRHPSDQPSAAPAGPVREGSPLGIIQIPRIGLDKVFVEGTSESDLQEGPGHYSGTPLPGQPGNAAIAGHRTTYGAPFYNLNELVPGDPIIVSTRQGTFRYDTARSLIVDPSDSSVIGPTRDARLTLTTCNPRFSAAQRLVVQALLVGTPAPGPPPGQSIPVSASLAGGQGSWQPALGWGLGTVAAGVAFWLLARRSRRRNRKLLAYGGATVCVLVLLFFFFESLSPLLPASL